MNFLKKIFNRKKNMDQQVLDQLRKQEQKCIFHTKLFLRCMFDDKSLVDKMTNDQLQFAYEQYLKSCERLRKRFQQKLKKYIGVK